MTLNRKLYKVVVYNTEWGSNWKKECYVEAETHMQAAYFALEQYTETREITATATHVPFGEVKSEGSVQTTMQHAGDGTESFTSHPDERAILWAKIEASIPGVSAAFIAGFFIAAIIFGQ